MTDRDSLGDRMNVAYGDNRVPDRVWGKLHPEPNTGCWLWSGCTSAGGYGRLTYERRNVAAHVLVFKLLVGAYGEGLDLDHLCRERACANPVHLEPVTRSENLSRGEGLVWMERAARTHCANGHPFSGENVFRDATGRRCRTCVRENNRNYKVRKKAA